MKSSAARFDPLARVYHALEILAFGGDLARARFQFLDQLAGRRSILILGEGDGRCLARLLPLAPAARIHCVDASPAMLARAAARIAGQPGRERVTWECADALAVNLPAAHYDAVITLFFLDCFDSGPAAGLVTRIQAALQPGAVWLFADFVLPERGLARLRARVWLTVLYAFFRWSTGLRTRELPPSESLILTAGFRRQSVVDFQHGLLRSALFNRLAPAAQTISAA
jgi:ubiquinone/menaquinone biosynthesis C-methylase UbiE